MRGLYKGYLGRKVALFPTMLDVTEPSTSPSRITSSPSPSPEPSPSHSPAPSPSPDHTNAAPTTTIPTQHHHTTSTTAEHIFLHIGLLPFLEDDLRKTKKTYSSALTKLILRVKKLEARVKIGKSRKKAKVVLSEDDADVEDDSSKQGRKLSDAEKGSAEISTAGATKGTASDIPVVSTAEEISTAGRTVTYTRRSEEKRTRQDKGKAIMIESEPKKKSKKELEQENYLCFDEEERQRVYGLKARSTKKIDWT
ncbi:hypothetical protein Tco_0625214 [Tanacetum coccineum]|uniref:Uncharacterized protein n=1 Tax=Tanacetum coccineum TaxID=301880 RepID=A0ABQ4WG88_9ASTR